MTRIDAIEVRENPDKFHDDVRLCLDLETGAAYVVRRGSHREQDVISWPICPVHSSHKLNRILDAIIAENLLGPIRDSYTYAPGGRELSYISDGSAAGEEKQIEQLIGEMTI